MPHIERNLSSQYFDTYIREKKYRWYGKIIAMTKQNKDHLKEQSKFCRFPITPFIWHNPCQKGQKTVRVAKQNDAAYNLMVFTETTFSQSQNKEWTKM